MYTRLDQLKFNQKQKRFVDTLPEALKTQVAFVVLDQLHELNQRFVEKIKRNTPELNVKKIEKDKDLCAKELQLFKSASFHLLHTPFYWYPDEFHQIGPLLLTLHSFWEHEAWLFSNVEQINIVSTDFSVGFCLHEDEYSYSVITWGVNI